MFENYPYFLLLAEENNVTRAAEKLHITHQALSRYLSKLEQECGGSPLPPEAAVFPDSGRPGIP